MVRWVFWILLLLLTACQSEKNENRIAPTEEEISYVLQYGWHISDGLGESSTTLEHLNPEYIDAIRYAGVDLRTCTDGQLITRTFALEEKQADGGSTSLSLYYCNDELLGAVGGLENWSPGRFAVEDKQRLIEDGIIQPKNR